MSNQNQGIELIKAQFDQIYTTAFRVTREFNNEYIPLNTLKVITDKSKFKKVDKGMAKFIKLYNELMATLYECSESYCKEQGLQKGLPLSVLKMFINQIKINL